MNKSIVFILGAATGALVTWKIIEKKYKDISDKEINEIREYYKEKDKTDIADDSNHPTESLEKGIDLGKAESVQIENEQTTKYYADGIEVTDQILTKKQEEDLVNKYADSDLYLIDPDRYSEFNDYSYLTLYLYKDNVTTDESGNICVLNGLNKELIKDIRDSGQDTVYLRSEVNKMDYEVFVEEEHYYDN